MTQGTSAGTRETKEPEDGGSEGLDEGPAPDPGRQQDAGEDPREAADENEERVERGADEEELVAGS